MMAKQKRSAQLERTIPITHQAVYLIVLHVEKGIAALTLERLMTLLTFAPRVTTVREALEIVTPCPVQVEMRRIKTLNKIRRLESIRYLK